MRHSLFACMLALCSLAHAEVIDIDNAQLEKLTQSGVPVIDIPDFAQKLSARAARRSRNMLTTMKPILFLLLAISAAANPIRVLYLDTPGADTAPLHNAMRDLGRDAIYFDYSEDKVDAGYALVVKAGDDLSREAILSKLSPERKAAYEAFLAQREPEQREKHPQVANYEKRPEPPHLSEAVFAQRQHGAHAGARRLRVEALRGGAGHREASRVRLG